MSIDVPSRGSLLDNAAIVNGKRWFSATAENSAMTPRRNQHLSLSSRVSLWIE